LVRPWESQKDRENTYPSQWKDDVTEKQMKTRKIHNKTDGWALERTKRSAKRKTKTQNANGGPQATRIREKVTMKIKPNVEEQGQEKKNPTSKNNVKRDQPTLVCVRQKKKGVKEKGQRWSREEKENESWVTAIEWKEHGAVDRKLTGGGHKQVCTAKGNKVTLQGKVG